MGTGDKGERQGEAAGAIDDRLAEHQAIDDRLAEREFMIPGTGDFGDRFFRTTDSGAKK